MNITYLHHSGFVVECPNVILIFDPIVEIPNSFLNSKKPKLLFVSHSHGDHYSSSIWDYSQYNLTYIISSDIYRIPTQNNIVIIKEGDSINIDNNNIRAFGSTDQGVSFLVETSEDTIFFAGDLNWWAWDSKTRPHINPKVEERDYKKIIQQLKVFLNGKVIDCAFVPVDPRLDLPGGEFWAALYFIDELHPKELVPMHFWGDFDIISRLKNKLGTGVTTKIGTFKKQYETVKFNS